MTLVIDASVAVKFVVREDGSDRALELIERPDPLIAPDWLLPEAASAMWRMVKNSELLMIHAERNLEALPEFFESLVSVRDILSDAYRMSFQLKHPVYDCLYLALAVRERCPLITADKKFLKTIARSRLAEHVTAL